MPSSLPQFVWKKVDGTATTNDDMRTMAKKLKAAGFEDVATPKLPANPKGLIGGMIIGWLGPCSLELHRKTGAEAVYVPKNAITIAVNKLNDVLSELGYIKCNNNDD